MGTDEPDKGDRAPSADGISELDCAKLAREGDVEGLFGLMDLDASTSNDRQAYKWLCAASDFGHEEADDRIDDVLEVSTMRYDDSGYERATAHWELAVAYLTGEEGLPLDLTRAHAHLEEAFEHHDLQVINEGARESYAAQPLLDRLTGEARALLAFHLAGGDLYARVCDRIARVEQLRELGAPQVLVESEERALAEAAEALFAAGERGLASAPGMSSPDDRDLERLRAEVQRTLRS